MLGTQGTGVATYARALREALGTNAKLISLLDHFGGQFAPATRMERWIRWCDAIIDRPRALIKTEESLRRPDIFRLAQVHFDRHQTLLRLRAPGTPGIMHWTYPLPAHIEGWINIYTVHDAIPLTHPSLTPINGPRHLKLIQTILAGNGHILTVSHAAKHDIVASFHCDPDRVSVCPTGLALSRNEDANLPGDLTPGRFFLTIGSVEPRKNLMRLVKSYEASGTQFPLVVAGPSGWRADEIEPLLGDIPGIVRLTYMPRHILLALISHARALLFPSLAEGFGLPIAEAMTLGTAVMTSYGGATEEVAGAAGLLVDPLDIRAMTEAIMALSDDDGLVERLVAAGRERSADFTMPRFAQRMADIHSALLMEYVGEGRAAPYSTTFTSARCRDA